ncbi:hypothetical protein [Clostridium thermobutyricum]|uniref:hypothetical protein n=1 Tax=Clostridium thermobutyricum TaxID=29372 RepID=UPI0018A92E2F|nr:hypothetical protein [Clostridium thermobutyricum]
MTSDEVFKCVADIFELKKYAFKHSTSHKYWNKNELKNEIKWLLKSLNKNIYELSINDLKSYRLDEGIAQVYNRDYYKFLKDISRNTNLNKCKIFDELYRFKISLCKDIIRDVKTHYNFKYLRELKLNDIPEKYIKDIKNNFNGLRGFKSFAVDNFSEVKIIGKYGNIIS